MLEELHGKLGKIHLQLSTNHSSWASSQRSEDAGDGDLKSVIAWLNACGEWWDGPYAEWSVTRRMSNFAKLLGLRKEMSFVVVGHSSFWLDYFKHFIKHLWG